MERTRKCYERTDGQHFSIFILLSIFYFRKVAKNRKVANNTIETLGIILGEGEFKVVNRGPFVSANRQLSL